ncbi:bifunctional diaminohydroxyphosphoribosylaminopyrimidine deaminase/5-amino-6-(5-phosphoribosylamino)uracil reductase RibD [Pseudoalteromonas byunsanensis]|uniref:Riboflavin biosynthesis protein RibD n=1 Tax=Pseudoalteromonas byunsanensis TaxID=327939 RepID=A0A1S1N3C8_9GAMM|nr:bifunctional diaminohydroxyphosphoribosylaminopyrimidine deaminase/5-amino-6-(5-phosphoribosylamino)uracil reductase RibD [Pseudoalteromonas byunsanensis]OHU93962.1 riboflavin biosynthesis protein RibD [Pseudoalteromonas byunsanensis]
MFSEQDHHYMAMAIALAKKGRFTTTPNPNVGCVIVKDNQIVGQGYHQRAGDAHAEVHALRQAADKAVGATAYVTLEPCSHHGRTPPCAEGLINAGVCRVVAAMVDPNPKVAGRGLALLQQAGVETAYGLLENEARALNRGFLKRMEQGLPYVTCKLAASLDGKTALKNGQSKWITGPLARRDVQQFRAQSCAILTGADTVIVDDAKLNVRENECAIELPQGHALRQPVRVIIDSQNRLTPELAVFQIDAPIIIFRTHLDNNHQWPHFVEQIELKAEHGKVSCRAALKHLASCGINSVWLESGATLAGVFAQQQLIDEYVVYLAPKLIGHQGKSLFHLPEITMMDDAAQLEFTDVTRIGDDIRITAKTC